MLDPEMDTNESAMQWDMMSCADAGCYLLVEAAVDFTSWLLNHHVAPLAISKESSCYQICCCPGDYVILIRIIALSGSTNRQQESLRKLSLVHTCPAQTLL